MCGGSKTVYDQTTWADIVESDRLARIGQSPTLNETLPGPKLSLANRTIPTAGDRLAATDPNVTAVS